MKNCFIICALIIFVFLSGCSPQQSQNATQSEKQTIPKKNPEKPIDNAAPGNNAAPNPPQSQSATSQSASSNPSVSPLDTKSIDEMTDDELRELKKMKIQKYKDLGYEGEKLKEMEASLFADRLGSGTQNSQPGSNHPVANNESAKIDATQAEMPSADYRAQQEESWENKLTKITTEKDLIVTNAKSAGKYTEALQKAEKDLTAKLDLARSILDELKTADDAAWNSKRSKLDDAFMQIEQAYINFTNTH